MPLMSADQLHRKYGHFASERSTYRLIEGAVSSGIVKKDEIPGGGGVYTVAGYCELCLCKYIFENRCESLCAKFFANNVAEIVRILASASK